jgi:murein DD-endopeptidase MepM/ murein hydrolase activator NlpD
MKINVKLSLGISFLLCMSGITLFCFELPEIHRFSNDDVLYLQLQEDIADNYKLLKKNYSQLPLSIYKYKLKGGENVFQIAAALSLPYDTLATLNRFHHSQIPEGTEYVLIPNFIGLFIPQYPFTELEYILSVRIEEGMDPYPLFNEMVPELFFLLPDAKFNEVERAYFLNILFRYPLHKGQLTSAFGYRQHPFKHEYLFHNGIDIAAQQGSDVFAARDGVVAFSNFDSDYGNYIVLAHLNGYTTLYAHLDSVIIAMGDKVHSGQLIGYVGNTGSSTAPHLHFEIRRNGLPKNPDDYLRSNSNP